MRLSPVALCLVLAFTQTSCSMLTLRARDPFAVKSAKVLVRVPLAFYTLGLAEAGGYSATDCLSGNRRYWGKDKVRGWSGTNVKYAIKRLGPPSNVTADRSGLRSFFWLLPEVDAQPWFGFRRADENFGQYGMYEDVPPPERPLTPKVKLPVDDRDRIIEWSGNCVLIPGESSAIE